MLFINLKTLLIISDQINIASGYMNENTTFISNNYVKIFPPKKL
jgi:hypothetical protein